MAELHRGQERSRPVQGEGLEDSIKKGVQLPREDSYKGDAAGTKVTASTQKDGGGGVVGLDKETG